MVQTGQVRTKMWSVAAVPNKNVVGLQILRGPFYFIASILHLISWHIQSLFILRGLTESRLDFWVVDHAHTGTRT